MNTTAAYKALKQQASAVFAAATSMLAKMGIEDEHPADGAVCPCRLQGEADKTE